MEYHKIRFGGTVKDWQTEISNMKKWAKERTESMYDQLKEYYTDSKSRYYDKNINLGTPVVTKVNEGLADCDSYIITVNDIPLTSGVFAGKLFTGRKYSISAERKSGGSEDIGWRVIFKDKLGNVVSNNVYDRPLCEVTPKVGLGSVEISLIASVSGIDEAYYSMKPVDVRYYNMQGVESASPSEGMNIIRYTYPDGSVSTEKLLIE